MNNELPTIWKEHIEVLDIAFQPILNIHNGKIFAVEALLRNYQDIGFKSIFSLFDHIHKENILYSFDLALREKAFKKFTAIKEYKDIKLFFNLDNRLLEMPNFSNGNTIKLLKKYDIKKESICFEISERHEISGDCNLEKTLQHYKDENFCIAIDDFGIGYSGYKLLYDTKPNIIKIDRFFLQGIEKNLKKRVMLRSITHLAIQLGIKVIAEGVETKEELLTCKYIGCHLIQGYLIQRPTKDTDEIIQEYSHIVEYLKHDKRAHGKSSKIEYHIDKVEPIPVKSKMSFVVDYFKNKDNSPVVPVINSNEEAVGIIYETQIKEFLYSPYGRSLLLNDGSKSKLKHLLNHCASADINSSMSIIIELFSNDPESVGIIITKNSKYHGFLSARAIISIINEENILLARDQNPLTKLPGNRMIDKYISTSTRDDNTHLLCYFDLDNFKAFNDVYGFRNGDRVIQLFADILRKYLGSDYFKGHIGGDDFFVAIKTDDNEQQHIFKILDIIEKFTEGAKNLYSQEDKKRGYILANNRDGIKTKFPLLTASASLLIIHKKTKSRSLEYINNILSAQKKVAKNDSKHISISSLL